MADIASEIHTLEEKILDLRERIGIEAKRARIVECEAEMAGERFWLDRDAAARISQEFADLKEEVDGWDALLQGTRDLSELTRDASPELLEEIELSFVELKKKFSQTEFRVLLSGPYDRNSALLAIHAGTGGVDAMDWAEMLLRMYLRFCEQKKWRVRILDEQRGGEAGVKSAVVSIEGAYAYGYLKAEHGVHRLVRISPFDAEKMRHTSFALVEVIPDLGDIAEIDIRPEDIRIDVFRSSGAGGQSVNTTDSAVRITHVSTGIVVSCQNERSQSQNKETALRYLKAKLHRLKITEREEERQALRGAYSEAAWGNQIRSYVIYPYKMVKDHRTEYETSDTQGVLDGDILPFIESYLRHTIKP
ncbi:peptide chain release factor 2 [Candidatus Uhrbacteria bacterium]|nr:peptide chain release factor 2 [Candidatus Uhrbacteria bacterium]